jgi:hypothetical protein
VSCQSRGCGGDPLARLLVAVGLVLKEQPGLGRNLRYGGLEELGNGEVIGDAGTIRTGNALKGVKPP